jgi:hypothetical protein
VDEYISMKGSSSNNRWHQRWFYLRSNADMPLPLYTGRYFEVAPAHKGYGPIAANKENINTLLQAVKCLVNQHVTRARVIVAFHKRRVLPLMRQARRLDEMVLNAPLKGTVLMMEELDREEIKRIKSALGSVPSDAALDLYPLMHPDDSFIEIVSTPTLPTFPLGFLRFLSIA